MAVISEGTATLPTDGNGHVVWGGKDSQGNFWFPTVDDQHSLRVALWSPTGQALLTVSNPGVMQPAGDNILLLDQQAVFGASAAANTEFTFDINLPSPTHPQGWAYISFVNPSTVSAMTLTFENKETYTYSGTNQTLYSVVSTVNVPQNTPNGAVYLVQGWLLGDGARLSVKNASIADAAGVTCKFRVRKV